jgi:hypothetical protein
MRNVPIPQADHLIAVSGAYFLPANLDPLLLQQGFKGLVRGGVGAGYGPVDLDRIVGAREERGCGRQRLVERAVFLAGKRFARLPLDVVAVFLPPPDAIAGVRAVVVPHHAGHAIGQFIAVVVDPNLSIRRRHLNRLRSVFQLLFQLTNGGPRLSHFLWLCRCD